MILLCAGRWKPNTFTAAFCLFAGALFSSFRFCEYLIELIHLIYDSVGEFRELCVDYSANQDVLKSVVEKYTISQDLEKAFTDTVLNASGSWSSTVLTGTYNILKCRKVYSGSLYGTDQPQGRGSVCPSESFLPQRAL